MTRGESSWCTKARRLQLYVVVLFLHLGLLRAMCRGSQLITEQLGGTPPSSPINRRGLVQFLHVGGKHNREF